MAKGMLMDVVVRMTATELGKLLCDKQTSIDDCGCSTCPARNECGETADGFKNGFIAWLEEEIDAEELLADDGVAAHEDEVEDQERPKITLEDMI